MTGPEHYRTAERLLQLEPTCEHARTDCEHGQALVAEAQVHATLALAAAFAFNGDMTSGEWPGWLDAAGSDRTKGDAS